ncbi:unnamed protein product [Sphagnum compactum]
MRIVFYPFLLGDVPSIKNDPNGTNPWRGRITYDPTGNLPDVSTGAEAAVSAFLGTATSSMFSGSNGTSTVTYSGSTTDWTYRRMILHYAKLCAQAGGVDLFLIGSELRGLETIRGRNWTRAGSSGTWDYPFLYGVQGSTNYGMVELAGEVQTILATASGYSKSTNIAATSPQMLVTYSPDWSSWMGWQHSSSNPIDYGQWPHLDQLYASSNIDLVSFDNYLPISDWTTAANGGLDGKLWAQPLPSSWPPSTGNVGLGLTGNPSIYSIPYLQANIEGGEKFNWYSILERLDKRCWTWPLSIAGQPNILKRIESCLYLLARTFTNWHNHKPYRFKRSNDTIDILFGMVRRCKTLPNFP